MGSQGSRSLSFLVADGVPSFAQGVVESLESVDRPVSARAVTSPAVLRERIEDGGEQEIDGVVVGDRFDSPIETIETLTDRGTFPVVLLTGPPDEAGRVSAAVEAGITDYFPRTTDGARIELLVEHVAETRDHRTGGWREYEAVFDALDDAVTIHDPAERELLDVNEVMADVVGRDRETVLEGGLDAISATEAGYTGERAYEVMDRVVETDEAETHEWLLETATGERHWVEARVAPVTIREERRVLVVSREITARRAVQERLTRERDRRSILFENNPDPIMVVRFDDETPRVEEVNPEFEAVFGFDETSLTGQSVAEAVVPESEYDEYYRFRERAVRGEPSEAEVRRKTEDGIREFLMRIIPFDVGAGPQQAYVWYTDITERKRRAREFEEIFNSVNDVIAVHDPETGDLVDVNDTYVEKFGYDLETIRDLGVEGLSVTEEGFTKERGDDIITRVADTGEPETSEWLVEHADGERRWYEVNATNATIGGVDRVLAISRDVTERKRREREFEQIFHGVQDPITVHDLETAEVLEVNDSFCELLGYDREEILEMGVEGFSCTDRGYTAERAEEFVDTVVESGSSKQMEWAVETSEGETRWLEVKGTTAEIDGEVRYISIDRDVTEQKRREREYEQIFDGVTDAITVHHPETGDVLDLNETMCELTGYDREEFLAKGQEAINVPEEGYPSERAREIVREVMDEGEPRTLEWLIERKDGERRWLEVNATPATLDSEERYLAIMRDITEQRRTERRLRAIVDRIDEAIYFSRADQLTTPALHPDDLSAGYEEIWGQPLEEVFATHEDGFFDTLHPGERDGFEAFIEAIGDDVATGAVDDRYSREYRIERPDGEVRWVRSDFYPTEWETGPSRIVIVSRDITHRKAREQRIASFHEATRELTAADSREMACRQAIAAAENVLGFSQVSTHLYDEQEGVLAPTAATSHLETADVTLPAFDPGDSLPWQVFVEGESVTSTDPTADIYGGDVADPDVVLSLGTQGVMLVGAPDHSFDAEDVELAQILAATLEAALNHVAGERALTERERELQQQRQRAERFEQLTSIMQDIEQVIVEHSSRTDIEEAVCDRLTDVDVHELVWVAEPTIPDDDLAVRTSAGDTDPYLDALSLDADAGTGTHPATDAYRANEMRVVENVATAPTGGDWRKAALRHGVQSVMATPISYDGTVHGILTVGAEDPAAFDEPTRDVLAELGRSIGYAITVTEREQALESEGTIELEFSVGDEGLFMIRGAVAADCCIELERTVRRTSGAFSMFYVVDGGSPADVVELATRTPSVEHCRVVSGDETGEAGLVEVTVQTWFGSVFTDHGAVVRRATAERGTGSIVVEAPRGANVRQLVEGFREQYPATELVAQRQRERTIHSLFELQDVLQEELTDRQWEAFQTAYSAGYFEWPRDASGEEVAELLDVTQPTFNKHLRLAERKAVRLLLERETTRSVVG